jgi:hypothetical protein
MKNRIVVLLLSIGALSGCAASVDHPTSDTSSIRIPPASSRTIVMSMTGSETALHSADWEPFKGEWRAAMASAVAAKGAKFGAQEGPPRATGEPGTWVVVDVRDYRYLTPGARFGFGIMTGNAYIDSTVQFVDLETGTLIEDRAYNTSSSAWQGIFSAMTDKQVRAICDEVVATIDPR